MPLIDQDWMGAALSAGAAAGATMATSVGIATFPVPVSL